MRCEVQRRKEHRSSGRGREDGICCGCCRGVAALVSAGYFELNDKYATEEDGCERIRTDSPTHNWSVERDAETKALSHYLGCEGVEALDRLEEVRVLLVRKAEIQLWIAALP